MHVPNSLNIGKNNKLYSPDSLFLSIRLSTILICVNLFLSFANCTTSPQPINYEMEVYNDINESHDFQSIITPGPLWITIPGNSYSPGWSSGVWWVKIILNDIHPDTEYTVELLYPHHDEIIFYYENNEFFQKISGKHYSFDKRDNPYKNISFNFKPQQEKNNEIILRFKSKNPILIQPLIQTKKNFQKYMMKMQIGFGIIYGLLAGALLFNLLRYFHIRNRENFYLVLMIFFNILGLSVYHGHFSQYLLPDNIWLKDRSVIFIGLAVIMIQMTTAIWIKKYIIKYIHTIIVTVQSVLLILMLLSDPADIFKLFIPLTLFAFTLISIYLILDLIKKNYSTLLYLTGMIFLICGILINGLAGIGILPYDISTTDRSIETGLFIQIVFYTYGYIQNSKKLEEEVLNLKMETIIQKNNLTGELHDSLGSEITTLLFEIQKGRTDRTHIINTLSIILDKLRDMVYLLHLDEPASFNVFEEIIKHIKRIKMANIIQIEYDRKIPELALKPSIHLQLHRIFLELMSNALKHSQSKKIRIRTRFHKDILFFCFNEQESVKIQNKLINQDQGYGMKSIARRVALLGGKSRIFKFSDNRRLFGLRVPLKKT